MKSRLIIIGKSAAIFIGTVLLMAVMAHLFPPNGDGFVTANIVLVPIFVSALSSTLYMIVAMIKPSKEPFLLKTVIITNILVVMLSLFT